MREGLLTSCFLYLSRILEDINYLCRAEGIYYYVAFNADRGRMNKTISRISPGIVYGNLSFIVT